MRSSVPALRRHFCCIQRNSLFFSYRIVLVLGALCQTATALSASRERGSLWRPRAYSGAVMKIQSLRNSIRLSRVFGVLPSLHTAPFAYKCSNCAM